MTLLEHLYDLGEFGAELRVAEIVEKLL